MFPMTPRERAASGTLKSEICLSVQHGPFLQEWEGLLEGCQGFLLMHRQNKIAFICRLVQQREEFLGTDLECVRELHENVVILLGNIHHILNPGYERLKILQLQNRTLHFLFLR